MARERAAGSGATLNASLQWRFLGSHCVAVRVGILPLLVVFTSSTSTLGMQLRRLSYSVETISPPFSSDWTQTSASYFELLQSQVFGSIGSMGGRRLPGYLSLAVRGAMPGVRFPADGCGVPADRAPQAASQFPSGALLQLRQ